MTFEPVDDGDDESTAEAAPRPIRLLRGPLTRRRERRILIALTYFGPLDEYDLYGILHATSHTLTKALLNLTAEGLITCKKRNSLFDGSCRVWSMRAHQDGAR